MIDWGELRWTWSRFVPLLTLIGVGLAIAAVILWRTR